MTAIPGFHGRYLRIDLARRTSDAVPIPPVVLRRYLGGSGLGTWLLHQQSTDRQDPLSPAAPLIFIFSPLVGSPLTTSAKFAVLCQSPLTGRINDSLSSSHFAIAGKKTGYDAFVLVGASTEPVFAVIEPDQVRFELAQDLWGLPSQTAAEQLTKRIGPGFRVAAIGPAGENLVHYATVSHDGRHAGRGGSGAVMGSKRLKALAVRGDRLTPYAHPQQLLEYSKELSRRSLGPATEKYRELGTISNLVTFNRLGTLPTRNFQSGTFAGAEAFAPETLAVTHTKTRDSCAACTIGCEHIFQLAPAAPSITENSGVASSTDTAERSSRGVRLEYENLFALGPLCGISEPDIVLAASAACDRWGLDTISAGGTIAFAMECAERGLIDAPALRFGNGAALLQMLDDIALRRGLGDLLADGSRAAAARIGQGAADFAPHVKGLEIPGYEPRALQTMALGFAVGTRGADHNRSSAYQVDFSEAVDRLDVGVEGVAPAIRTENEATIMDSLILCKFLRGVFSDKLAAMAEMLHLVTGWDVTATELAATADRIVTAKKWYNVRQGWTPDEDTLPTRFLSEKLPDGASAGAGLTRGRLEVLIAAYNTARGWSREGVPTAEQIADCGLTD